MIRGVIFDLGGTLVTQGPLLGGEASLTGAKRIVPLVQECCGWSPTAEQLAETLGSEFQDAVVASYESGLAQPEVEGLFAEAMAEMGCDIPPGLVRHALDRYFLPYYESMQPVGDVLPTLTMMSLILVCSCCAGNFQATAQRGLRESSPIRC